MAFTQHEHKQRNDSMKLHVAALSVLALFMAGCSKQGAGGGGFSLPPMPVEVAQAKVQKVVDRFEAVGSVEALEAITVVSEIDAAVIELPFREGGLIRKNEMIAHLDDSQLSAELSRAEALEAQSHATYAR